MRKSSIGCTIPRWWQDVEQYRQLMKESAALQPIVEKYREYTAAKRYAEEARDLLDGGGLDKEMRELAEQELAENREKAEGLQPKS